MRGVRRRPLAGEVGLREAYPTAVREAVEERVVRDPQVSVSAFEHQSRRVAGLRKLSLRAPGTPRAKARNGHLRHAWPQLRINGVKMGMAHGAPYSLEPANDRQYPPV